MNIDAYKGCKRPAGNRHDHALIRCTPERGWFCFACEVESLTAEIEQLRNKLMEGENLAQEFSYFGMRNEIGKKHPALQKRIDDFIKSSFPLLLTKGSLASSLRASGYSEKDDDTEILNLADADYGPESDKDTEPVCPVHKQKLAPGRSCEYCAMDDALDEHLSEKDNG